jgi:phage host-nuclease inhibitor protein Gam
VAALKAEADAAARAAGEAFERAAAQPQAELEELRAGVQAWCEAHRAEICGRAKSAEFATGRVSWRLRPPRVTIRGLDAAIEACRRLGLGRFLRERVEINREAMLADPEAARLVPGVAVASAGEDFVIEPAEIAPAGT